MPRYLPLAFPQCRGPSGPGRAVRAARDAKKPNPTFSKVSGCLVYVCKDTTPTATQLRDCSPARRRRVVLACSLGPLRLVVAATWIPSLPRCGFTFRHQSARSINSRSAIYPIQTTRRCAAVCPDTPVARCRADRLACRLGAGRCGAHRHRTRLPADAVGFGGIWWGRLAPPLHRMRAMTVDSLSTPICPSVGCCKLAIGHWTQTAGDVPCSALLEGPLGVEATPVTAGRMTWLRFPVFQCAEGRIGHRGAARCTHHSDRTGAQSAPAAAGRGLLPNSSQTPELEHFSRLAVQAGFPDGTVRTQPPNAQRRWA
jgi:hypothetical protein